MAQKSKKHRRGNKANSLLNRERGRQKKWKKRYTSSLRRIDGKFDIKDRLKNE